MIKYKFSVWPTYDDETEFNSLLDALASARVFSIDKHDDHFFIGDEVDNCFGLELTKNQLLSLSDEISELACTMPDS